MVARAVSGLPGEAHAQVAEAYGCRVGLRMIMDTQCRVRTAEVAGDNLNVVRCCAVEGRLRRPQIQELLEGPPGDCAARGWALKRSAVRRRENEAADSAATDGVYMAAVMAERGNNEPRIHITRYDRSEGRNRTRQEE